MAKARTRMAGVVGILALVLCSSCAIPGSGGSGMSIMRQIAPVQLPPEVRIGRTDDGPVFTDAKGMTLYFWQLDKPGESLCKASGDPPREDLHPLLHVYASYPAPLCVQQWPPFIADDASHAVGDWSIIARHEGSKQWAYKGHPLYTFYKDQLPGDINGIGASNSPTIQGSGRHPAEPQLLLPPGVIPVRDYHGLLVTVQGTVLYTLGREKSGARVEAGFRSGCEQGKCPGKWLPFYASEQSVSIGKWTVVFIDGAKQWAYDTRPVFRFQGDHESEDANGIGVDQGLLLVLQAPPAAPEQVSVHLALLGPVYTNPQGLTLYVFECATVKPPGRGIPGESFSCDGPGDDVTYREQYCPAPDQCRRMWLPFEAPANAKPRGGTWSVAEIPDPVRYPLRFVMLGKNANLPAGAIRVWTFKGKPLYTYTGDRVAGDIRGEKIRQLAVSQWGAVLAGRLER
jgi:predicted lipoprotein with Yx(FWY)xxD motif